MLLFCTQNITNSSRKKPLYKMKIKLLTIDVSQLSQSGSFSSFLGELLKYILVSPVFEEECVMGGRLQRWAALPLHLNCSSHAICSDSAKYCQIKINYFLPSKSSLIHVLSANPQLIHNMIKCKTFMIYQMLM